jgi:hypothetical protein
MKKQPLFPSWLFVILLLTVAGPHAFAQVIPKVSTLPPLMRIELAQEAARTHKTIVFRDTMKSAQLQSALVRDTSKSADSLLATVKDSALATIDSLVAEPTKAHLDSGIAELPEFSRVNNSPHFEYPLSIMTEPYRVPVPFDTTILGGMNPISRESLPYFDEHPMPIALKPEGLSEGHIVAGAGTIHLPYLEVGYAKTLDERWSLDANGTFFNNIGSTPLHTFWSALATLRTDLGVDPSPDNSTSLSFSLASTGRNLTLYQDSSGLVSQSNHTISLTALSASLFGQWSVHSTYDLSTGAKMLGDNLVNSAGETSEWFGANTAFRFDNSGFGMKGHLSLDHSGSDQITLPTAYVTPATADLLAMNSSLQLTDAASSSIQWAVGLNLFSGSDISGTSGLKILPSGSVEVLLTPDLKLGGSFDPGAHAEGLATLIETSPFLSSEAAMRALVKDSGSASSGNWRTAASDPRRVATDKFLLTGFVSYALSADDETHAEVLIADRSNDVVFYQHLIDSGKYVFYALPEETRRLTISAGSNLLLFASDILSLNVRYSDMTTADGSPVPFEPVLSAHAGYSFNSLSTVLKPGIDFQYVTLKDRSFAFFNVRLDIHFSTQFAILLRGENLFGGSSDYWTGYSEVPQSFWISASLKF